jgi:hypothetical protein
MYRLLQERELLGGHKLVGKNLGSSRLSVHLLWLLLWNYV